MLACLVVSESLWPYGLQSTSLLSPQNFPSKNTGVGCHFLLQGIFLTQGLDPHLLRLLHWQESQPVFLKYEVFHTSLDSALGPSHQLQMSRRIMNIIPLLGRSSGGGYGNPLQYSWLENPMDRGVWWATVHGVTRGQTRLKQFSTQTCMYSYKSPQNTWDNISNIYKMNEKTNLYPKEEKRRFFYPRTFRV